ncbi:MAG: adenylate/guanylate cyclase domain-containing protein, partial [Acidimicrobiales bacterium]
VAVKVLTDTEKILIDSLPDGARLVKTLGDGAMLWFPLAAEAVTTALDLQRRFLDENVRGELPLWVRIGGHYGTQTIYGDDLVGHDVNLAARICDQAGPGEVLVSEASVVAAGDDVSGGVDFLQIGPTSMKGIPDPVWLYRAVHAD